MNRAPAVVPVWCGRLVRVIAILELIVFCTLLPPLSRGVASEPQLLGVRAFDVPAGDARPMLRHFARAAGCEIIFAVDHVAGIRTNAVKGEFTTREALGRMLEQTGLVASLDDKTGAIAVRRARDERKDPAAAPPPSKPTFPDAVKKNGSEEIPDPRPMKTKTLLARVGTALALMSAPNVPAQSTAQTPANSPAASNPAGAAEDVTVLSPYVVDTTQDRGYQAANTLSGTRLNTSLRDTPASVSVFTPEFLQDIGLDSLGEIVGYSVNSEVEEFDTTSSSHPDQINAQYPVKLINTRGIRASQGLDYFKSITPDDAYRIHRYDDSRGPNGILFGVSDAGGLINQTSKVATTLRDSARIKWSGGSYDRNRTEFDLNKILLPKKLAVSVAGVHQESGGRLLYDFQDKRRAFGSVVYRPHDRISITVMGEKGRETNATVPSYTTGDYVLAWLDNRDARGVNAVTFTPNNTNPSAAMVAVGVTTRNAAANGANRRITYIVNDGTLFDSVGTFLTGSYNNPAVRAPDGTPGVSGDLIRINDPALVPYHVNANGPGMFRDARFKNYTITGDWQIAKGLYANFGHNFQENNFTAYFQPGAANPRFYGEANRTLGLGGPPNPYVGGLFFQGEWRKGTHPMTRKENRASLAYEFSRPKWGSHRIAALASRVQERDALLYTWLALSGAPFGGVPDAANNRVTLRQYVDERNYNTYAAGDWRKLPPALTIGGQTYDWIWANAGTGAAQNAASAQKLDTGLVVIQSHFLKRRLVTTVGYRDDRATITAFGYANDPIYGFVPDFDPAKATDTESRGITRTQGVVFHAWRGLSLIANFSSNIGLPDYNRKVFPDERIPEPSRGKGHDYGLALELFDRKLTAKAVYYETVDSGRVFLYNVVNLHANPNIRIMDAFETVLAGPGRAFTAAQWAALEDELTPSVSGAPADTESKGYEFSVVANPTRNMRLTVNYAYTDRSVANVYVKDVIPWYGFKMENGLVRNGVTQDATGTFILDPNAYEGTGTIARWIELSRMHPDANLSTLMTTQERTIAEEIFVTTEGMNDQKRDQEKRWGLRPHRVSLFAAYDFTRENLLKGFSIGGGFRWRSANIIGTDAQGKEITGKPIRETDFMLRYARSVKPALWKGRLIFQLNVINVFDEQGIIPRYFSANPPYEVPGGRGLAYNRFDVIAPRTFRFTTTYEF